MPARMSVHHVYLVPTGQKTLDPSEPESQSCDPLCRYQELSLEQQVCLTTAPSLSLSI